MSRARIALLLGGILLVFALLPSSGHTPTAAVQAWALPQAQSTWPPRPANGASLPALKARPCSKERSLRSLSATVTTWVFFRNRTSRAVSLYWLSYRGRRVYYNTLAAHTSAWQETFATHPWVATLGRSGRCLSIFVARRQPSRAVIKLRR